MSEKRILLIEDEATTREILTEVLRGEGYEVDSVATAGAATTCLESIRYALVMADWLLPDGHGTDVADAADEVSARRRADQSENGRWNAGHSGGRHYQVLADHRVREPHETSPSGRLGRRRRRWRLRGGSGPGSASSVQRY